jgi:hypothetical protein
VGVINCDGWLLEPCVFPLVLNACFEC